MISPVTFSLLCRFSLPPHSAKITIDKAMAQMNLVSSGLSRESSMANSSDLASFNENHSENACSFDSSALGQAATLGIITPGNFAFKWKNKDNAPKIHLFSGTPGVKANLSSNSSILDIFQTSIPTEKIDLTADETNCYAVSKPSRHNPLKKQHDLEWKVVTNDEIKVALRLCILMGVVKNQ